MGALLLFASSCRTGFGASAKSGKISADASPASSDRAPLGTTEIEPAELKAPSPAASGTTESVTQEANPPPNTTSKPLPPELPGPHLRWVPPGKLRTSTTDRDEPPAMRRCRSREVACEGFWIDETEVTVSQYDECVSARRCRLPLFTSAAARQVEYVEQCNAGKPGHRQHPINCVTYAEARTYCRWAGKRLPTQYEWERVARGDDTRVYPWGIEPPNGRVCWAPGNSFESCPVGSFPAGTSHHGVYDLAGNVMELTDSLQTGSVPHSGIRTFVWARGCSFRSFQPSHCAISTRVRWRHNERSSQVGFRCVLGGTAQSATKRPQPVTLQCISPTPDPSEPPASPTRKDDCDCRPGDTACSCRL